MREPFEIEPGAWWVLPDGRCIVVPSFHESWLKAHPAIAGGARNTIEFVQKSGWLSVTLHSQGFLEVIARSMHDARQRQALRMLIEKNAAKLAKLVLFIPGVEGCVMLEGEASHAWESVEAAIDSLTQAEGVPDNS